ncbi:PIN domain protein [Neomoorella glycerini]|uniref:PIN domain protein n=1 Tax=Neomoorella glycerini TaxID=55779 RepID=A0A6I5ZUC4_9FIRM|nr:putative toxin-antitoxin system toxin component, PIN family [Moorella glycerini]QGP93366.1 PIN domain protein [Moorella glycerini]
MSSKRVQVLEPPKVPVVIDTNVLVPSLYSNTPIAQFLFSGNLILVWSAYIYNEACEIIYRLSARYLQKAGVFPEEVLELLKIVTTIGREVTDMPEDWPPYSRDREDDPFLWAALVGGAEYIISEDDSHMLELKSFQGIPIGTPRQFFEWVKIVHPITLANKI